MFGHRFNWIFASLLGIYSFLNILILEGDRLFQAELAAKSLFFVVLGISFAVWFGNLFVERVIQPRFKKIHPLFTQFLVSFLVVSAITLISVELTDLIFGGPYGFTKMNLLLTGGFAFRINLFLNSVNAIVFFNKKYQQQILEAEKLKTLTANAQMESMNAQLNPHFFFNNLNALSALIHNNVNEAEAYLQKLAGIYRYLLKHKGNELVSLNEELHFLEDYLNLLQIRFGKALQLEMSLKENSDKFLIAPAVLQILVENIVKHNFFTEKKPLQVKIQQRDNSLIIWNQKQKKSNPEPSMGVGLKNISDRYTFLHHSISVQDEASFFQVEIPLIEEHENTFSRR